MSETSLSRCPLCDRAVKKNQATCSCGAVLAVSEPSYKFDFGQVTSWIPLAALFLMVVWIAPMSSFEFPVSRLFKLGAVTVIISSLLGLLDIERIDKIHWTFKDDIHPTLMQLTSVSWFFAMLIAWPVMFPAYFYVHYAETDNKRMKRGIASTAAFILFFIIVWIYVANKHTEWPSKPLPPRNEQEVAPVAKAPTPTKKPQAPQTPAVIVPAVEPTSVETTTTTESTTEPLAVIQEPTTSTATPASAVQTQMSVRQPQVTPTPTKKPEDLRDNYGVSVPRNLRKR